MTSLYHMSISVLSEALQTLGHVLDKGIASAKDHEIEESDLLNERLYPNMFNFRLQLLVVLIISRATVTQLTGRPVPEITQRDQTMAQLYEQLEETRRYVDAVNREDVDGKEEDEVSCFFFGEELRASARDYVQKYALPIVYFHLSMVYAIFRSRGVPLGKKDYVAVTMKDFKLAN